MKLRAILKLPKVIIDRVNPLSPASGWFLRNAPTYWRASVVPMLWYYIIGFALLALIGFTVAREMTQIPSLAEMMAFQVWVYAMSGIVLFGWVMSLLRTPMIDRRWPQLLSSACIYAFFVYGLLVLPNAYLVPVSNKVVKLYGGDLEADKQVLERAFSELCGRSTGDGDGIADVITRVYVGRSDADATVRMIEKIKSTQAGLQNLPSDACIFERFSEEALAVWFGPVETIDDAVTVIREWEHLFTSRRGANIPINDFSKVEEALLLIDVYFTALYKEEISIAKATENFSVTPQIHAIEQSASLSKKSGLGRWMDVLVSPKSAALALSVAIALLVFEHLAASAGKATKATSAIWNKFAMQKLRFGFEGFDQKLLRDHPKLWVGRYHVAAIVTLTIAVVTLFSIEIFVWLFNYIADKLNLLSFTEATNVTIATVIILGFIALCIALIRAQARNIFFDREAPGALIGAFFALFLPAFLGLIALLMICVSYRMAGNTIILEDVEIVAALGSHVLFAVVMCYVGLAFGSTGTMLKALAAAVSTCAAMAGLVIATGMGDDDFHSVMSFVIPIYFVVVLAFPRKFPQYAGGETGLLYLAILGAVVPISSAYWLEPILEDLLGGETFDDIEISIFLVVVQLLVAIALIPAMRQMHRALYEPQEN